MREYELHPDAYTDLDEIGEYIGRDSPDTAKRVVDEIFNAVSALAPFPHRGHRRTDLTSRPLRFIRERTKFDAALFEVIEHGCQVAQAAA
jgi:plasmid stabilization system protein ParE